MGRGRFRSGIDREAAAFSSSLSFDSRLYAEDIEGSLAHVAMLAKQKILDPATVRRIATGLKKIRRELKQGKIRLQGGSAERFVGDDVHMAIENLVTRLIGTAGEHIHTARSRNDQIALDERLYLRASITSILKHLRSLQRSLLYKAEQYESVVMPGYTHLQRAQPILLAHHLLAYVSMLDRDRSRLADCFRRVNLSPLGACALAGTSFRIDRRTAARNLGFAGIIENSIDAVSDRDVLIEFQACAAIIMMHLSRLAEDIILWNSEEWGFAAIGEKFTTGSSIMPNKKNPDIAELVRGKCGRVYGNLVTILTVMKGLPLAYNRDLQEDKEPLFDTVDTLSASLGIFSKMVRSMSFRRERFANDPSDFYLATELADFLASNGVPFRKAHEIVGSIVSYCMRRGCSLRDVPRSTLLTYSPLFSNGLTGLLDANNSIRRKRSEGSTSPREVRKSINKWKETLSSNS